MTVLISKVLDDADFILIVLSLVSAVTVYLGFYLIKEKEKKETNTEIALKDIKDLLESVTVDLKTITNQVENNTYMTREHQGTLKSQDALINSMNLKVHSMSTERGEILRRIGLLEKITHSKLFKE
jgi:hypothetical protein